MNRETIEKAAGEYSGSILGFKDNPIVMANHKAFAAGADWLADYLCKIPFDKMVYELHEYFKNKIEREKNA